MSDGSRSSISRFCLISIIGTYHHVEIRACNALLEHRTVRGIQHQNIVLVFSVRIINRGESRRNRLWWR